MAHSHDLTLIVSIEYSGFSGWNDLRPITLKTVTES